MTISCAELITRLENIRRNKIQLDQEVGEFEKFNREKNKDLNIETEKLIKIYGIRKEINKEIANIKLELAIEGHRVIQRTVLLGNGIKTVNDFDETFRNLRKKMTDGARDLVSSDSFTVSNEVREVKLIYFTISDVELPVNASFDDIYKFAKGLGLELCPAEVGPELRLQKSYAHASDYVICMQPILDSHNRKCFFDVIDEGGEQLLAVMPIQNIKGKTFRYFVFVRK